MRFIFLYLCLIITTSAFAQNAEPVKGTWITNVASNALLSKKNIKEVVANCKKNGLNSIFVVVWNGGVTMYPSKIAEKYIGIKQAAAYKKI
ncbi:MAG: family 10 glycosylhydrolase [Chitinophagaceae bacterium]|nr:family 10 glycosylhydrolase [Chitinophagaceae bacterium]